MNADFFIKNLWRRSCGLPEQVSDKLPSLAELRKSEWNKPFEQMMRNRLIMGAFRYGLLEGHNKPQYDRVDSMHRRLNLYTKTGNMECLVDVANLCLLEFTECHHPNKHFHSVDDGEHTQTKS